jgi:hypothetical protein
MGALYLKRNREVRAELKAELRAEEQGELRCEVRGWKLRKWWRKYNYTSNRIMA